MRDDTTVDVTWPVNLDLPYLVTDTIGVNGPSNPTLTIEPGVQIQFTSGKYLSIGGSSSSYKGKLIAQGTQANPIIFTGSEQTPGYWRGVYFYNYADDTSVIENCVVEYAGSSSTGIYIKDSSPTIKNTTVQYSSIYGIYTSNSSSLIQDCVIQNNSNSGIYATDSSALTVDNCVIRDNANGIHCTANFSGSIINTDVVNNITYGIYLNGGNSFNPVPIVNYNNIHSNGDYELYSSSYQDPATIIDAKNNWWGTGDFNLINERIYDHNDNSNSPFVNFEPYSDEEGNPVFGIHLNQPLAEAFVPVEDSIAFDAYVIEPSDWQIAIKNELGQTVRTITQQNSETFYAEWFGYEDDLETVVGDGIYTYIITATSTISGTEAYPHEGEVTVDSAYPIARITFPEEGDMLSGINNQITGTAKTGSGIDFDRYVLSYADSIGATNWIQLINSPNVVEEDVLFTWDGIIGLTEGNYALKLETYNETGNAAFDYVNIEVLNIYDGSVSMSPFSPNADGVKDTTNFSASITQDVDWTVTIKDELDVTVNIFSGSGSAVSVEWDGTNSESQVVGDGIYAYQIDAIDSNSGVSASPISGTVVVDNTYPIAQISSPQQGELISNEVQIVGTANDLNFQNYRLSYGVGIEPIDWITIHSSSNPVISGVLDIWDVLDLDNGDYVIRLSAEDLAGNVSVLDIPVVIDNIQITNIYTDPGFINPFIGDTTTLHYTLDRDAEVTIDLYRCYVVIGDYGDGAYGREFIMNLVNAEAQSIGENSFVWDGRNAEADIAQHSAYTYVITAQDINGAEGFFDPPYVAGSATITDASVVPESYDPYRNEPIYINYTLSDPAWVTIGGEYPANFPGFLLEGEPRDAGSNTETWDGRDGNGNIMQGQFLISAKTELLPEVFTVIADTTLRIDSLQTEAFLIIPPYNQVSTISYNITRDADVTIRIFNPSGDNWIIEQVVAQPAGIYTLEWDGTDLDGRILSQEGNYRVEVTAEDIISATTVTRSANITVYR